MRKVYSLFPGSIISRSALWLCLCCTVTSVWAGNPPVEGDNLPPCTLSINPSSKEACPDQELNLRGGPHTISFTASLSGGGSYAWTVENTGGVASLLVVQNSLSGQNTATVTMETTNFGRPGTVTLRCTATGGCGSTYKLVTVNTNPSPNTHAGEQWKCSTSPGGYAATWNLITEVSPIINNGGAWTVKYYSTLADAVSNSSAFSNGQASSYAVNVASKTIYARIESSAGCWLAGPVPLRIWPKPTSNPTASAMSACSGTVVDLFGNPAGGSGNYTAHQWVHTGGSASGVNLTNASSQNAHVSASGSGTINLSYEVTDDNGCSGWNSISINI